MNSPILHVAEPPPRYLPRPPLVVDASVLAVALFQEASQGPAQQELSIRDLHAPYLLQYEMASVAVAKASAGFDTAAREGLLRMKGLAISLHVIEEEAVVGLALRYGLTACDAAYLWLAECLLAPLATFDEKLAAAARDHLSGLT